jgi:hypothetical protein
MHDDAERETIENRFQTELDAAVSALLTALGRQGFDVPAFAIACDVALPSGAWGRGALSSGYAGVTGGRALIEAGCHLLGAANGGSDARISVFRWP